MITRSKLQTSKQLRDARFSAFSYEITAKQIDLLRDSREANLRDGFRIWLVPLPSRCSRRSRRWIHWCRQPRPCLPPCCHRWPIPSRSRLPPARRVRVLCSFVRSFDFRVG